jgi:SAM-dependent methyltransferase
MLQEGADLVSVDYSTAAEVNYQNNKCDSLFVAQADLFQLPFQKASFDYVFCFGVLQHTPDPIKAFKTISGFLKPGGKISIDNYIKRLLSPFSTPKYVWRPLTARMNPEKLLKIIKFYVPFYLPFDTTVRRIPRVGPQILALIPIPCWNYIGMGLSAEQRKEWAILDTFDALSATYDIPLEIEDFEKACAELSFSRCEVFYGSNGIVTNAQLRG